MSKSRLPEHWFVTSVPSSTSHPQLVAVSGQHMIVRSMSAPKGEPQSISTKAKISVPTNLKEALSKYSARTVFVTTSLRKKSSSLYELTDLMVVQGKASEGTLSEADPAFRESYEELLSRNITAFASTGESSDDSDEPSSGPRRLPLINRLMKKYPRPDPDEGFVVDQTVWAVLVRNTKTTINTLITGPTGTGKTELIYELGKSLGMPVHTFDMGSMYDPISGLLGNNRLRKDGDNTVTKFEYSRFAKAIQTPSIILLDEVNRAPVATNNLLFPCLDRRRTLFVEMADDLDDDSESGETKKIKVHDECVFFATANIGGEYAGTNALDRALQDRFFMLELNYLTSNQEIKLLLDRNPGLKEDDADMIVSVARDIRDQYNSGTLSTSVSTRHTLSAAQMVVHGFSVMSALELSMLPMFDGDRTTGEKATVLSILSTK